MILLFLDVQGGIPLIKPVEDFLKFLIDLIHDSKLDVESRGGGSHCPTPEHLDHNYPEEEVH